MSDWAGLASAVGLAPDLSGALCKGRHELFDAPPPGTPAEDVAEHAKTAKAICGVCPVLDACTAWADTLTALQRPHGVTAGRKYTPPPTGRQGRRRTQTTGQEPATENTTERMEMTDVR